jgi:hypothetical protein
MSHFAEIKDGVVQRVIVAEQDFINSGLVGDSFNWVQTSYNGNFRKQYAGSGYTYDKANDVFVRSQPYPSWTLDSDHDWQPPTPKPDGNHHWNEETQVWDEVII